MNREIVTKQLIASLINNKFKQDLLKACDVRWQNPDLQGCNWFINLENENVKNILEVDQNYLDNIKSKFKIDVES